jgi:hypothetical protein
MQLFFYPILFILPFKFVKYITKCIKKILKNDIWNESIKKVWPQILNPKQNKIIPMTYLPTLNLFTYLFKPNYLPN